VGDVRDHVRAELRRHGLTERTELMRRLGPWYPDAAPPRSLTEWLALPGMTEVAQGVARSLERKLTHS